MKKNRIIVFLLVAVMMLSMFPLGSSAAREATPGSTVELVFTFPSSYGVSGEFTFSDPSILSGYKITSNLGGNINIENNRIYLYGTSMMTVQVTVTATISPYAAAGSACNVVFNGETVYNDNAEVASVAKSDSIKVVAPVTTAPDTQAPEQPSTPQTPSASTNNPKPTVKPTSNIDYSELNRQIGIANGLKKDGYTNDSWDAMIAALNAAKALRTSQSQSAVDAGAKRLADAIAALQKVDYSKLQEAIDTANKYKESNELTVLWNNLNAALDKASQMLSSGDQAAIDEATAELIKAFEALKSKIDEISEPQIKEVIKEVEKEVEPKSPFCNIHIHTVWLILLIISAVINVAFIVLTVLWFMRKKKNQKDDTPLVKYDIGDDD